MNYRIASLFYCLFVLWSKGIAAQTPDSIETKLLGWMARGDTSVFAITQEANNYLDTTQSASKEAFAKKYGRWYNVWNNRIDSFGQIDKAANKMLNYLSEISEFDQICENGGDWKLLGPLKNTESGKQNLGIVVTFHTQNANSDTVIIGSNSGGIWRTINANDTFPDWECISDLSRKPAMGVSSIVVDPNNPLILYAATGNHSNPPSVFYGMGVLKSTDGGYILPEGKKEAMLKVVDAYGRLLLVIPVNADKNNEMFNVAHWAAGTYYVYLEGNGWKSKANSFVVCN